MNITTAAGVKTLSDKMVIQKISGRLIKLYDYTSGMGDMGTWSHQNGVLEDGTGQVKVHFKNRDEIPKKMLGKIITISAVEGKKGWNGVYAEANTYEDTTTMQVKVTPTGEVTLDQTTNEKENEPEPPTEPDKPEPESPQPTVKQNAAAEPTDAKNAPPGADQLIDRAITVMKRSIVAAHNVREYYEAYFPDKRMSDEQFASVTAQIFKLLDNHALINQSENDS